MALEHPDKQRQSDGQGCLIGLAWLAAGLVLPVFGGVFYRRSARRGLASGILFFLFFAACLTAVFTLRVVHGLSLVEEQLDVALATGQVPEIQIRDGEAHVEGPDPLVILDENRQLMAIDTTGRFTQIDPARYDEGVLLTRSALHVLNRGGEYNTLPLRELHEVTGQNPIVIDAQVVREAWGLLRTAGILVAGLALLVWHFAIRLGYLCLVALAVWVGLGQNRRQVDYRTVLTVGLYAAVPALYGHYLLMRAGLAFAGLQTLLLILIWVIALRRIVAAGDLQTNGMDEGFLLRQAVIGVPMLLVLGWDAIFTPEINPLALWLVPLLTLLAWWLMRRSQPEEGGMPPLA